MFNKEKTKKIVILVLFAIAVIGLVGYGVYSVEYESNTFVTEASVTVGAFDPQTIVGDTASFLGSGGLVTITCPTITDDGETICTGSMTVKNNGNGPIVVEILEPDEEDEYSAPRVVEDDSYYEAEVAYPTFSWNSKTLAPNETAILNISVSLQITSDYNSDSEVTYENGYPYESSSGSIDVNFRMRASQYVGE